MDKSQLIQELKTIQAELRQLAHMIVTGNWEAKNHQVSLHQHVTRIIKELEDANNKDGS